MKTEKTGQMLVDLYGSEQDVEAKKSIISSLGEPEQRRGPGRHRAQGTQPPAQDGNRPQAVGDGAAQQGGGGLSDGNHQVVHSNDANDANDTTTGRRERRE